ncbi:MAG: twin-arginine translocase subunit TatC [Acidimicrobiales bacterium]
MTSESAEDAKVEDRRRRFGASRLFRGSGRRDPNAMTLAQHLVELRKRLLTCVVAVFCGGIAAFFLYPQVLAFLQGPYCNLRPGHCGLYVTGPLDGLSLRVSMATYGGLVFSSPVLLWQVWRFITPGLDPKEKRYAIPFVAASIVLFLFGMLVAYVTFPHALAFLIAIGGAGVHTWYNPMRYVNLIVLLMVAFGIAFEFPVLLVSLELAGVLSPAKLSSWRRWAIVAITAVAAFITPSSDPFSMMALAIPMYLFYEVSILIGKVFKRS